MELPPLPPLNDKLHMLMRGPTLASNWVIPGMVMAGAYPGALDDRENELQLRCVLNKGIDTFVCLQLELDDEIPEEEWRSGNGLRPYFIDARRYSKKPLIWRHLPIMDGCACPDDEVMEALVCDLLDDVKAGRVLYVHCLGGHGRTGIVVSLLLAVLYGLPVNEAFKRVQAYHDCRIEPQGVKSPSTVMQRSQVKRLLQMWNSNAKAAVTKTSPNPEVSDAKDSKPEEPKMVIGKNGARGFVVPVSEPVGPLQEIAKEKNAMPPKGVAQGQLARNPSGPLVVAMNRPNTKTLPSSLGMRKSNSTTRQISLHAAEPSGVLATRMCTGKAAGTGVAAVQMLRKSTAKLAVS